MRNFLETIRGAAVGDDTKRIVTAASEGNLDAYKNALKLYNWSYAKDYTMVLLIFSPIVVAMNAISNVRDDDENDDTFKNFEKLAPLVDKILRSQKMIELCENIGRGDGVEIKRILNGFAEYKTLLKMLSDNKYGMEGPSDMFIERAGGITRWVRNEGYIRGKLIPLVRDVLGSRFSNKITIGLTCVDDDDEWRYDFQVTANTAARFKRDPRSAESKSIPITDDLRRMFAHFGQPLDKKALRITENELFKSLMTLVESNRRLTINDLKYIRGISGLESDQFKRLFQQQIEKRIGELSSPVEVEEKEIPRENFLLRELAKDWMEMCASSKMSSFLAEDLKTLVSYHKGKAFTEEDIVSILGATMRYRSELEAGNYDTWLDSCGFELDRSSMFNNISVYMCRSSLGTLLRALIDWVKRNRVKDYRQKEQFLNSLDRILTGR